MHVFIRIPHAFKDILHNLIPVLPWYAASGGFFWLITNSKNPLTPIGSCRDLHIFASCPLLLCPFLLFALLLCALILRPLLSPLLLCPRLLCLRAFFRQAQRRRRRQRRRRHRGHWVTGV